MEFRWKYHKLIDIVVFLHFLIFTNVIGDNEDTTPHDQSSEEQFNPLSPNLLSDQANQITWPSLGEFADHIIF